jgi:hypothetical protein
MVLGLVALDPLVRGMDPDPSIKQKKQEPINDSYRFVTCFGLLYLQNYVNVPSKSNKQQLLIGFLASSGQ